MNESRTRLVGVALALAVVTSLLTVASVAPASAAENSFVIEQGDRCIPVTPISGSESVEEFYDYRSPENTDDGSGYSYSSYMPASLQAAETSRLFLYDGPNGVSIVMIHNERGAGRGDSAATFRFAGLPSSGEWAVVDDSYDGRDDQISRTKIDWTWMETRSDGGVFRGIDRADLDVTISPRWNEDAALYDSPVQRSGRITSWQVLSGSASNPQVTTLPSMTEPVTIRAGSCGDGGDGSGDETSPNADLTVNPTEPSVGESVAFDARDANDESGIVEYRWDFDGDGTPDDTTSSFRTTHAYESAGTYDASVTVADAAGNTATANVSVTVGDDTPLEAKADVPANATVGQTVTVDGSASTGDIVEYAWSFAGTANTTGETAPYVFSQAGEYDVILTVTDAEGKTDSVAREIVINEAQDTTTPDDGNETTTPDDGTTTPENTTTPDDGSETTTPEDGGTTPDEPAETPDDAPDESDDDDDDQSNSGRTNYNSGASYSADDDDEPTPTPEPEPPEMSVSLNRSATGAVNASVRHAKAGETATVELAGNGSNATYRSLDLAFANNGSYDLALRASESPGGVPALSIETDGATPFAYLNVSHPGVTDGNVSNANVTFAVSEERLAAANASAKDVALYRHHDGAWTELDVRHVEKSNGTHVFTAKSSGLSTFAVGAKRPSIAVEDVTLSDATVESGNTVTVTAKVANHGGAAGSYTVDLTAYGEVVDSKKLTLDAGESKSVTFVRRMSSPGAYDLSVNGESATLQVTGSTATTGTTSADDDTPTTNGAGQPGFGVAAALAAILAAFVAARRRR